MCMKMHWIDSLTERYAVLNTARNIYCGFRSRKNAILNILDKPVIVLLYHRVADLDSDPERLAVSPTHFREQMNYLKEHYRIVRFEGDWSGLQESAVAVTFDDGYADNFYEALPILEETGVPATFSSVPVIWGRCTSSGGTNWSASCCGRADFRSSSN